MKTCDGLLGILCYCFLNESLVRFKIVCGGLDCLRLEMGWVI